MSKVLQRAWLNGFIAGLAEYAWWKDGTQYVGSCGTTLTEAIERAVREYAVIDDDAAKAAGGGDDD